MRELELKAVVPDLEDCRARLLAAGAVRREAGRQHDWRYDTADRQLRARDVVLRVRQLQEEGREHASLDWKGPASLQHGYKAREEVSLGVHDAATARHILQGLGYQVSFEIEREIETYELAGALLRFERYARMDTLLEVEGEPAAIERAIAATGIPRSRFTAGRLADFAREFEERTGQRAAVSLAELAAAPYARDDA